MPLWLILPRPEVAAAAAHEGGLRPAVACQRLFKHSLIEE